MELDEGMWGLIGVVILFTIIFTWCLLEDRADRKRDKQKATYDKWAREQVKER